MERDGRFFARLVIPKNLKPFLDNKTELRTPLGGDRRAAMRLHAAAVAATYASYYGGLAGIVAALYFLYLAALILIFGGELNRAIRIRRLSRALRRDL